MLHRIASSLRFIAPSAQLCNGVRAAFTVTCNQQVSVVDDFVQQHINASCILPTINSPAEIMSPSSGFSLVCHGILISAKNQKSGYNSDWAGKGFENNNNIPLPKGINILLGQSAPPSGKRWIFFMQGKFIFLIGYGRGVPRILLRGMHIFGCSPPPPLYFSNVALHWSSRRVGGDARASCASCASPLGMPLGYGTYIFLLIPKNNYGVRGHNWTLRGIT